MPVQGCSPQSEGCRQCIQRKYARISLAPQPQSTPPVPCTHLRQLPPLASGSLPAGPVPPHSPLAATVTHGAGPTVQGRPRAQPGQRHGRCSRRLQQQGKSRPGGSHLERWFTEKDFKGWTKTGMTSAAAAAMPMFSCMQITNGDMVVKGHHRSDGQLPPTGEDVFAPDSTPETRA